MMFNKIKHLHTNFGETVRAYTKKKRWLLGETYVKNGFLWISEIDFGCLKLEGAYRVGWATGTSTHDPHARPYIVADYELSLVGEYKQSNVCRSIIRIHNAGDPSYGLTLDSVISQTYDYYQRGSIIG